MFLPKRPFLILLAFLYFLNLNAKTNPLINTPSLSPDGQTLAFNYQGDIWTVSINGNNLKRLTIHEAYDTNPFWSSDGKTIAFQSNRFGNYDIFTIPANGGLPNRITYHSSDDIITDFTSDGTILFYTFRNYVEVEREPEIHSVSSKGGTPFRFMDALGFDATISPNGKYVAFTKGYCRIEREAYKGPANRDIWLYDIDKDQYHQLTTFEGQDLSPQWANNSTIYFQSARDGVYNVHRLLIDETGKKAGTVERITSYDALGLFSFDLSQNGKDLIMVSGDQLSKMDASTKKSSAINLEINSDYRFDPKERKTFSDKASDVAVSPNGTYRAIVIRGEIFIVENDSDKSKTINVSNSPYRDESPVWLSDDVLLFVSDRNGAYNLFAVSSSDAENKTIFTSLKHKTVQLTDSALDISNLVLAPDKKSIAFNKGNGELIVASISEEGKLSNEKTLVDTWDRPSNVAWSPDSKWISYNHSDLYFN